MSKSQPATIGYDLVQEVLAAILHATPVSPSHPLKYLCLVDQVLADPTFPHVTHAREYALTHLLLSSIVSGLRHHRDMLGFDWASEIESRQQAVQQLHMIGQQGYYELTSWTVLYYRYVRSDLNLPLSNFYDSLCVNERTFRRYQRHGIHRLTNWLIKEEWRLRLTTLQAAILPLAYAHEYSP